MSKFECRWSQWSPSEIPARQVPDTALDTGNLGTCRTFKRTSAGFAGWQEAHSKQTEVPPQNREIESLSLAEFAGAGLIVRICSEFLRCDVLFVSDNVSQHALKEKALPFYCAADLRRLAVMQPEPHTLRWLHEAVAVYKGEITDVR